MKTIQEVIVLLKEKTQECIEYAMPEWMLADDVVTELNEFDVTDYNVFDIFSRDIIESHLIPSAEDNLLADMIGGKVESFFKADSTEAKMIDHSNMIPLYVKVIGDWEKDGWVEVEKNKNNEKPVSIRLK